MSASNWHGHDLSFDGNIFTMLFKIAYKMKVHEILMFFFLSIGGNGIAKYQVENFSDDEKTLWPKQRKHSGFK